jgi:uncharacterized protein YlxW (UPF0749 family)
MAAFSIKIPANVNVYVRKIKPLARHHYFIVTILLFSGVGYVIYTVNQTLTVTPDEEYRTKQLQSTIGSKFNKNAKDTIERIKTLQKSTDTSSPTEAFPAGRINPFAE